MHRHHHVLGQALAAQHLHPQGGDVARVFRQMRRDLEAAGAAMRIDRVRVGHVLPLDPHARGDAMITGEALHDHHRAERQAPAIDGQQAFVVQHDPLDVQDGGDGAALSGIGAQQGTVADQHWRRRRRVDRQFEILLVGIAIDIVDDNPARAWAGFDVARAGEVELYRPLLRHHPVCQRQTQFARRWTEGGRGAFPAIGDQRR